MCGKRGREVRWEWEGCVVKGGGRCGGSGRDVW